tara:strand:- start:239 stop:937 length:699 start_codon:yes stop_codon:yes gene_type:complete
MTNALLFSAGKGKRLRPITNKTPKCLVKIGNKILLDLWINKLQKLGIERLMINTHHLSDLVIKHIENNFKKSSITLYNEKKLLGTNQTFIRNIKFFNNNDAMILHTDNYCKSNLKKFYSAHFSRPSNCQITMLVFKTEDFKNSGIVEIDNKNIVTNYFQKNNKKYGNLANGAIFLISPSVFEEITNLHYNSIDFCADVVPFFLNRIFVVETKKLFVDIGTPEKYHYINTIIK